MYSKQQEELVQRPRGINCMVYLKTGEELDTAVRGSWEELWEMKSQRPAGMPHVEGFGNHAKEFVLHLTGKWGDNEGL